jgi:hypothetical protein
MNMARPNFIDSEYFYWNNEGNTIRERMKIFPNAPKSIQQEYEDYVSAYEEWERMNEKGFNEELPLVLRPKDIEDL